MDIIRAALYIRVSTEEQVREGYSVDAQKENLKRYAKNKGYTVVGIYADEGITARKKYTNRKEFMRLLEDVENDKIDIILFIKLDRWFRNVGDYYKIQEILDRNNVGWTATTENYDTTTANGRLYVNIRLAVAQDESDRTSERIKFVFEKKIKDGEVVTGNPPFGYKIENKRLVKDESKVEFVEATFNLYKKLKSVNKVCESINKQFNTNCGYGLFRRILRINLDKYVGKYRDNENYCPPYLSMEDYEEIKEIGEKTSIRNERSGHVYFFQGLVKCGVCGRSIVGGGYSGKRDSKNKYFNYRCSGTKGYQCTACTHISEVKIERMLLSRIQEDIENYIVDYEIEQSKNKQPIISKGSITRKIERLRTLYLNEVIELEDYKKDYEELQDQLLEIEAKEKESNKVKDFTELKKLLDGNFLEIYKNLSELDKRTLWHSVIKKIIIKDKQIQEIIFK